MSDQDSSGQKTEHVRNPLVLLAGSILIGLAAALVLFGDNLRNDSVPLLEQIPDLGQVQTETTAGSPYQRPADVGDVAINFALPDLDGTSHQLQDLQGQPVILNFWATWCPPCRLEMPELQAAFDRHQDEGLVILAVDYDEPADVVDNFFRDEMGLTFTPLLDQGGLVAEQYGVFNFPTTLFIDPDGVIAAVHRGPLVKEQIEVHLTKILPNQE